MDFQFSETNLAILCDLFWMVKRPFKGLSDLQLGDEKVTLNHLEVSVFFLFSGGFLGLFVLSFPTVQLAMRLYKSEFSDGFLQWAEHSALHRIKQVVPNRYLDVLLEVRING